MYQGTYRIHLCASHGDPRGREQAKVDIYHAVQLLRAEHEVHEQEAYALLVETAARAGSTVCGAASLLARPGVSQEGRSAG